MFLKKRQQSAGNKFYRVEGARSGNEPRRRQVYDYYREPPAKRAMSRLFIVLGVIALLLIGQSIFQIPWLAIHTIQIHGIDDVPRSEIEQRVEPVLDHSRWLIFKNNNFLLFKPGNLAQRLGDDLVLQNVVIKKKFPATLDISAEEKILPFVRQTSLNFIQLDYQGKEIGDLPTSTLPSERIIADERTDQASAIEKDYLEQATGLVKAWNLPPTKLVLIKFHLTDDKNQIIVSTSKGYKVMFTTAEPFAIQIQRLEDLLDQNIVPDGIQYIDLRFGDHLYFK